MNIKLIIPIACGIYALLVFNIALAIESSYNGALDISPVTPTLLAQGQVVCPPGVDPSDGTGCMETDDNKSIDPNQGGSSQTLPPPDGGFTPAAGAQSIDPNQGGSSQPDPFTGGFTPGDAGVSQEPKEQLSTETPPGFLCDRARENQNYQTALRRERETALDTAAAKTAYDKAKTMGGANVFGPGGIPNPLALPDADWEIKRTKANYDAVSLKNCHAIQDSYKALKEAGCDRTESINCD